MAVLLWMVRQRNCVKIQMLRNFIWVCRTRGVNLSVTCVLIAAEKDGLANVIFFDALEQRSMDEREAAQASALLRLIALAKEKTEHYQQSLADIDPAAITSPAALATLPVLRKSTLIQEDGQPLAVKKVIPHDFGETHQIFQSPGPIFEIGMRKGDWWCLAGCPYRHWQGRYYPELFFLSLHAGRTDV